MILRNRKIYIVGDINHEAYLQFTKRMCLLEGKGSQRIHIVLSSPGGDAQVALAFYDRIRLSPCPVTITATGLVASAAALILVAPKAIKDRSMTENSWLMVHDDNLMDTATNLRVHAAVRYVKQLVKFENQWNKLMADNTKLKEDEWDGLHKKETYLNATECVRLGVVGEII